MNDSTKPSSIRAPFYILIGVIQLAVPALALGCANVIFSAFASKVPDAEGSDASTLLWIAYAILAVTVVVLLSGKSIERLLERLSWAMILLIFSFLILVNCLFVPLSQWLDSIRGFLIPAGLPEDYDVMLLALCAATAGSGGLGDLAIAAFQILRVNHRFLPKELHPPLWRKIGLVSCGLFYGLVAVMLGYDMIHKLLSASA